MLYLALSYNNCLRIASVWFVDVCAIVCVCAFISAVHDENNIDSEVFQ